MEQESMESPQNGSLWTKKNAFLLFSIGYANFMLGTCYSLPAPFFPAEAERKGLSPTLYGLVFGAFQMTNLIMNIIWGKLMPHLIPRFVLVSAIFVAGSCCILFGILEFCPRGTPYIVLSFLVRIVEAVGVTAYITTCYGMLPILFPANFATVFSIMETLYGLGLWVGPAIGGALYEIGGYYFPFLVMGGSFVFATVLTCIAFSGKDDLPEEKTGSVIKMLASPGIIIDCIIYVAGTICVGYNDATLEPHLRSFNLKPSVLGSIFIIDAGIYALASPLLGMLLDRGANPHVFALFGCVLFFVSFILIGPVPFVPFKKSLPVIIVALVLQGFGITAKLLCSFLHGMGDLTRRGFPDNVSTYALYTGIMMSFFSLGSFAGPSLGGFLVERIGYENGTTVIVGMEAVLIVTLLAYLIPELRRRREDPPECVELKEPTGNKQNKN